MLSPCLCQLALRRNAVWCGGRRQALGVRSSDASRADGDELFGASSLVPRSLMQLLTLRCRDESSGPDKQAHWSVIALSGAAMIPLLLLDTFPGAVTRLLVATTVLQTISCLPLDTTTRSPAASFNDRGTKISPSTFCWFKCGDDDTVAHELR